MRATLDASRVGPAYTAAFQHLRTLPGFSQKNLLRAEMGSVLKAWAGDTQVATADQIERRTRARVAHALGLSKADANPARATVNNGARGGFRGEVWVRTRRKKFQQAGRITETGAFIPAWKHWTAQDWGAINYAGTEYAARLRARRADAQNSLGLARQSVIQIADNLGIDLNEVAGGRLSAIGIAKARAAIASSGKSFQNGLGYQMGDEVKFAIEGLTRLPYGLKIGMDQGALRAVNGRAQFIQTAYKKGAFDSMKKAAASFPNVFKVGALN